MFFILIPDIPNFDGLKRDSTSFFLFCKDSELQSSGIVLKSGKYASNHLLLWEHARYFLAVILELINLSNGIHLLNLSSSTWHYFLIMFSIKRMRNSIIQIFLGNRILKKIIILWTISGILISTLQLRFSSYFMYHTGAKKMIDSPQRHICHNKVHYRERM